MWPIIYNEYQTKMKAKEAEGNALRAFGQPYEKPNKVYTMMEVICSFFAENHLIGEGRPVLYENGRNYVPEKNGGNHRNAKFAAVEPHQENTNNGQPQRNQKNKKKEAQK